MHRVILYVMGLLCLFLTKTYGQETESFESKTKAISENIEKIVRYEREKLETATDSISLLIQNNSLSEEEAEKIKLDLAQKSADTINLLVAKEEQQLVELVQSTVDEQIANPLFEEVYEYQTSFLRRTHSQSKFAVGWRGVRSNGSIDKDISGSFMDIGFILKTRLFKDNRLFYLKHGLEFSFQYENLEKSQKHYVIDNNQTHYVESPERLRRNSTFRNSYLRFPIALEIDFSKKAIIQGKEVYRVNQGFKASLGMYIGFNIDSRQYLRHRLDNGKKISYTRRADWNISDSEYGLSASISYKTIGIYATYGLNPIFRNNPTDQRMLSFGIIFE